jgi:anti-sigma factor RsiW
LNKASRIEETDVVRRELSKNEVERLFVGAVDHALAEKEASEFDAELQANPELKAKFATYQRAISLLKEAPREKAPDALASMILRRTRRRRFQLRTREIQNAHFPAEVVVPMLIAALVAMFMLLASP